MRLYKSRQYRGSTLKTAPQGAKEKTSVSSVQLFTGGITITFREHSGKGSSRTYTYTDDSCGSDTIKVMKSLAKSGAGLNRFINSSQPDYAVEGDFNDLDSTEDLTYTGD